MKKILWIATALLMIAGILMAGCSPTASQNTGSFNSPDKVVKGGKVSDTQNINVKEINVSRQGDDTVIEFKLLYGSRDSNNDEARISYLPEYQVNCLGVPHRLVVSFSDIYYYDFNNDFDASKIKNSLLQSAFYKIGADNSGDETAEDAEASDGAGTSAPADTSATDTSSGGEPGNFEMYFNLSQSSSFKVEESGDTLKVTLRPQNKEKEKGFFATIDAFDDYQEGYLPKDCGFTPTICSDLENKLLISKKFDTKEQAESFKKEAQKNLGQSIDGMFIRIAELSTGGLPKYTTELTPDELKSIPVIKTGNTEQTLNLLLTDGKYLATAPDQSILFYRKYLPESSVDNTGDDTGLADEPINPIFQRLWVQDAKGNLQQLENAPDFSTVIKVSYSPSGKYIAILDMTDTTTAYVYDITAKNTYNMGEEGLGVTDDIAWDTAKDVLYSISGTDESKQLMVCDFTKPDHAPQALEEQGIGFGTLATAAGKLYFTDESEEKIYQFDFATGERKFIKDGPGFVLSPDGRYMAYFKPAPVADDAAPADTAGPSDDAQSTAAAPNDTQAQENTADDTQGDLDADGYLPGDLRDFMLLDLTAGTEKSIANEADISGIACSFSADSKKVFFINLNSPETDDEDYNSVFINPVFAYDTASGQSKLLFKTVSESIDTTKDPNRMYLVYPLLTGAAGVDVTYIYDFSK